MKDHALETEGKTVADAIEAGLRALSASRDDVNVEVLREPAGGFLGMGAKTARVRVSRKAAAAPRENAPRVASAPADTAKACAETKTLLTDLLGLMSFDARLSAPEWDPVQERVRCAVDGPDAERLLAADGRALEALQFLATLIVGRRCGGPVAVQVDAKGYWDRREQDILSQARRGVDDVLATGKAVRLTPMDAAMRRLIHRSLMEHPGVETSSEGEGAWRKVVIRPRKR